MEKVIITLRGADAEEPWCQRLRDNVVAELLSSMTLTTARLGKECGDVAAYLVTESVPIPPPDTALGERTAGLANIALLRRPRDLDEAIWRVWSRPPPRAAPTATSTPCRRARHVFRTPFAGGPNGKGTSDHA